MLNSVTLLHVVYLQVVEMDTSGWLEGEIPLKVVWRCATMECGEQYVIIIGGERMHQ